VARLEPITISRSGIDRDPYERLLYALLASCMLEVRRIALPAVPSQSTPVQWAATVERIEARMARLDMDLRWLDEIGTLAARYLAERGWAVRTRWVAETLAHGRHTMAQLEEHRRQCLRLWIEARKGETS
jgi:1,6-anhydro-N-acetylmuramate kinase